MTGVQTCALPIYLPVITQPDWLAYLSGERIGLGRNYLFASTIQTLFDIVEISFSALANLNDFSVIMFPELKINISELAEIRMVYRFSMGEGESEFSTFPSTAEIRVTGYF